MKKIKKAFFTRTSNASRSAYIKKIIFNALNQPEVRFTGKEHTFFDNVSNHYDSTELYFYVKNAINKAKEILVYVDDDGELID